MQGQFNTNQQEFNDRVKARLSALTCKVETSNLWKQQAIKAMLFITPRGMGLTVQEFVQLNWKLQEGTPLTCYEFATINNNLESLTADNLKLTLQQFMQLQIEVDQNAGAWNEQVGNPQEEVAKELMEEHKAKLLNGKDGFRKEPKIKDPNNPLKKS